MGEEKDLSALQDRIKALEEENARLKKRQQPSLSTRVVPMEPVDYDDLKRNNRILQSKLKKYRQILSLGGISELPLLIDQYLEASDRKLKQISAETMPSRSCLPSSPCTRRENGYPTRSCTKSNSISSASRGCSAGRAVCMRFQKTDSPTLIARSSTSSKS